MLVKKLLSASDEDLRSQFLALESRADIAKLLEVTNSRLAFHLYRLPTANRYATFEVNKKSGGTRTIRAPISALKIIQRKLSYILTSVYKPKLGAHGFLPGRSIVTNARQHTKAKFVLNLDLKDFFPSINFGRVRGMFIAAPYGLHPDVATTLAQICCVENTLPQGAPTSPIVSNMICARLDSQLRSLAKRHHCVYTRYADDITFSTSLNKFPRPLAHYVPTSSGEELVVGPELQQLLDNNGFEVNPQKLRLQPRNRRQEVTGLTTNRLVNVKRKYIRQIRAMLHAWEKYGYDAAEQEFRTSYDRRHRAPGTQPVSFAKVIRGKLDFLSSVRGKDDPVYLRLLQTANRLEPAAFKIPALASKVSLQDLKQTLWVLECEEEVKQGTAFMLTGYGLVTCDHVLGTATQAFQPAEPTKRYPVTVLAREKTIDLAILSIAAPGSALQPGDSDKVTEFDQITLLGFPNYRLGDTGVSIRGEVVGFRVVSTIRRLLISASIVEGNSGGPVLDAKNNVIGIAVTGADSFESAKKTENHGVIPITALRFLFTPGQENATDPIT